MLRRYALAWLVGLAAAVALSQCGQPPPVNDEGVETRVTAVSMPEIGVALATHEPPSAPVLVLTPGPWPTPTEPPTPTPVVYTIVGGDTLLAIAIDHNTTTEQILALNPGIRPELLQIGQQIILPPPMLEAGLAPGDTEPIEVEIVGLSTYQSPSGGTWILGEVVNQGAVTLENVQIEIRPPAEQGQEATALRAWLVLAVLPAGARSPFGMQISQALPPSEPVAATVVGGRVLSSLGDRYLDLEVSDQEVNIGDNLVHFLLRLVNVGEATAERIQLVATFYNPEGRVAGFSEYSVAGPLEAGQSRIFEGETAVPGGQVTTYTFSAQGYALRTP
jgi:LysM repeat protein